MICYLATHCHIPLSPATSISSGLWCWRPDHQFHCLHRKQLITCPQWLFHYITSEWAGFMHGHQYRCNPSSVKLVYSHPHLWFSKVWIPLPQQSNWIIVDTCTLCSIIAWLCYSTIPKISNPIHPKRTKFPQNYAHKIPCMLKFLRFQFSPVYSMRCAWCINT